MKPLRDWMILEKYEHTKSELALPDSYKDKPDDSTAYIIIDIGPGYYDDKQNLITPDVKVGDIIILEGMAVAKFSYSGKNYLAAQARYVAFVAAPIEQGGSDGPRIIS